MRRIHNYTPTTFAIQKLDERNKRKRTRSRLSCNECRRQKIKCTRGHPCESCLKHGSVNKCNYGNTESELVENGHLPETPPDSVSPLPVDSGNENGNSLVERRMDKLEHLVERIAAKVDRLDDTHGAQVVPLPNARSVVVRWTPPDLDQSVPAGDNSVYVGLKHQAPVVVGIRQGVPFLIGVTGWCVNQYSFDECSIIFKWPTTFRKQWAAYGDLKSRFKPWRQPSFLDGLPILSASPLSEADLIALVPSEAISAVLIDRFFTTLNVAYPIIEPESLKEEVKDFWKSRKPASQMWLACLLTILGIGYQLPVLPFPEDNEVSNGQTHGKNIISKVTQFVFSSWAKIRRPDTVTFQTLLLLVIVQKLYMEHPDGSDPINGLLSIVGKLACSMGLHRDPAMVPDMQLAEIKLRRKLWCIYLFCDLEHSVHSGMPFVLRASDYDTLDPEYLDGQLPTHGSTYQQCLFDAVPVWAEVVQMTHSTKVVPTNDEIHALDARLQKIDVVPWMDSGLDGFKGTSLLTRAIRHAILDCLNHRLRSILNFAMLDKSDPSVRRHATIILLQSATGIIKHQDHITSLLEHTDLATQHAWVHFVLSILRFNFFSACKDILFLLRECWNGRIPIPDGSDLQVDEAELLGALSSEEKLCRMVRPLSMSCIKEQFLFCTLREGIRERLRLLRHLNKATVDLHSEEARPIIQAMQRAMQETLQSAREAIDDIVANPDPPPSLAEWAIQRAMATSSQSSQDGEMDMENFDSMDWNGGAEDLMPMNLWEPDVLDLSWPFGETSAQDPGWWPGLDDPVVQTSIV